MVQTKNSFLGERERRGKGSLPTHPTPTPTLTPYLPTPCWVEDQKWEAMVKSAVNHVMCSILQYVIVDPLTSLAGGVVFCYKRKEQRVVGTWKIGIVGCLVITWSKSLDISSALLGVKRLIFFAKCKKKMFAWFVHCISMDFTASFFGFSCVLG